MIGSSKFIAGLVLGAAAGTAIVLFLQSQKGKEIINDIKDAANDAGSDFRTRMQQFDEEIAELMKKGKHFIEDLEAKARDAASSV